MIIIIIINNNNNNNNSESLLYYVGLFRSVDACVFYTRRFYIRTQ